MCSFARPSVLCLSYSEGEEKKTKKIHDSLNYVKKKKTKKIHDSLKYVIMCRYSKGLGSQHGSAVRPFLARWLLDVPRCVCMLLLQRTQGR
jgi:hypothetical protein